MLAPPSIFLTAPVRALHNLRITQHHLTQ